MTAQLPIGIAPGNRLLTAAEFRRLTDGHCHSTGAGHGWPSA